MSKQGSGTDEPGLAYVSRPLLLFLCCQDCDRPGQETSTASPTLHGGQAAGAWPRLAQRSARVSMIIAKVFIRELRGTLFAYSEL